MPRKPQPVPPIFQPEVAAEAIVWAAEHPRRELMVGWPTVKAILGNAVAPGSPTATSPATATTPSRPTSRSTAERAGQPLRARARRARARTARSTHRRRPHSAQLWAHEASPPARGRRGAARRSLRPSTPSQEADHEPARRRLHPRTAPRVGRPPHLRLSRRRDQRLPRRARPRRRRPGAHPGAPRGDGRVHGLRAREVHRRGRRLPGDLGPGRDPPAERPLRREARPPAGRRDRRPAGARGARRRLPAGGRPARRCSRTSRASTCRWRRCPEQVRHLVDRAVRIALAERTRHVPHRPERRRRSWRPSEPPRAHGTVHSGVGYSPPRVVPARRRPAARRPRSSTSGERVAILVGAGRARRRRRGARGRRDCSAPASRRRCSAGPSCRTTCRTSPARSACSARGRATR